MLFFPFGFGVSQLACCSRGLEQILGVPSMSILSRDPGLSRKPPGFCGKMYLVFEKNDG